MNVLQILSLIRHAGGSVVVKGGGLRVTVPPGLLKTAHAAVLAQHKAELLRLLAPAVEVDLERDAIQWVESLDQATAAVVVETAVREWGELVQQSRLAIPPCTRCRNPYYIVTPILNYPHYGLSARRSCAQCHLTAAWPHSFPVWYGVSEERADG